MIRFQTLVLCATACLALAACDKKPESIDEGVQQVQAAAGDVAASTEKLVEAVGDLSSDKVKDLAAIAAKFEKAPEEAKKMLEERGWTREQFDAAVKKVKGNDELAKIFDAAKKMAH